MCLYFGVFEHLMDIVAYCVCRAIEMSFFVFMMICRSDNVASITEVSTAASAPTPVGVTTIEPQCWWTVNKKSFSVTKWRTRSAVNMFVSPTVCLSVCLSFHFYFFGVEWVMKEQSWMTPLETRVGGKKLSFPVTWNCHRNCKSSNSFSIVIRIKVSAFPFVCSHQATSVNRL